MFKGLRFPVLLILLSLCLTFTTVAGDYRSPKEVFDKMEANLMKIKNRRVKFRIEATGALTGTFEGEILFKKGSVMDYRTSGKFLGKDHRLFLLCDGSKLRGGSSSSEKSPFEMDAPAGLRPGILIGMSRMGLMHNIARLAGNKPPDRIDGSVYQWLAVQNPAYAKENPPDSPLPRAELKQKDKKLIVVFYKLGVENEKNAGDVELWIDKKTNLPTFRTITVHFPQGDMFVTEKYEWSKA